MTVFPDLDTPALLIESAILDHNIREMQALADRSLLRLRPHVKSHKSVMIARKQLQAGACGIAVAKLAEAEVFARHGFRDIQIANEVVGGSNIRRLLALAECVCVSCAVDSLENARELSAEFVERGRNLAILIDVDTGLHRCGLSDPDQTLALCQQIGKLGGLKLVGIMTHAGHAYAAQTRQELEQIGSHEADSMAKLATLLRNEHVSVREVSVGSTPTAPFAAVVPGLTELRVGNYVFNDMVQVSLGSATEQQCSLTVLATVISCPSRGQAVIDAGSKALTTEQGAHGSKMVSDFGRIVGRSGSLARLSEEHGVILYENEQYRVGDRIRIIPNHACVVVNLFDHAFLVDRNQIIERVLIDARGCST